MLKRNQHGTPLKQTFKQRDSIGSDHSSTESLNVEMNNLPQVRCSSSLVIKPNELDTIVRKDDKNIEYKNSGMRSQSILHRARNVVYQNRWNEMPEWSIKEIPYGKSISSTANTIEQEKNKIATSKAYCSTSAKKRLMSSHGGKLPALNLQQHSRNGDYDSNNDVSLTNNPLG